MEKFVIHGGRKLNGVITVSGNKNEALPALAAAVLTDEPVLLRNLPRNGDVLTLIDMLRSAGSEIERIGANDYKICGKGINSEQLDEQQCSSLRAAILLVAPFITRFENFYLHPPGGDVIGRRRLDAHFSAFKSLGVSVKEKDRKYFFQRQKLSGCKIFLEEQSVTATENIMMAASLASGTTFLTNCACEPHVAGLGRMLQSMGASLIGLGTHKIEVTGVEKLSGTEHFISPDY